MIQSDEGPFDSEPTGKPPERYGYHNANSRWSQTRNGKWYAFYANIGPGQMYSHEHPNDPNWWSTSSLTPADDKQGWACRHGWMQGLNAQLGVGHCRAQSPDSTCETHPELFTPPSDEEVAEAARRLVEMESKLREHAR